MAQILHAYKVWVHPKGEAKPEDWLPLGNLDGTRGDKPLRLIDELRAFLDDQVGKIWTEDGGDEGVRILRCDPADPARPNSIEAVAEALEAGRYQELRPGRGEDVGEVEYIRTKDKTASVEVLISGWFSPEWTWGLLVVHMPDGLGVKTQFWESFSTWFKTRHDDLNIKVERTVPAGAYIKLLEAGELKEVSLIRSIKPVDSADGIDEPFANIELGREVRTVKVRRGAWHRSKLVKALKEGTPGGLLTFGSETYTQVKVGLQYDGKRYNIDLSGDTGPRGGEDISEKVNTDPKTGKVDIHSVKLAAQEYIELLRHGGGTDADA